MFSRGALVAFVVGLAEFGVFALTVDAFGFSTIVLVSLGAALLGFAVVRREIPALLRAGRAKMTGFGFGPAEAAEPAFDPADGRLSDSDLVADRALKILAGMVLILPGLVTGLLGALLLLPPIRVLVRGFARDRLAHLVPQGIGVPFPPGGATFGRRSSSSRRDVVDVDVVSEDMPQSAPPELG